MAAGITLNRSRQVPAEDTPAFGGIAERFRRAGDLDRAIALCRDGLKKFPDHLSARVTLGWALLDLGKYDEARVELEQALKRAPDNLAAIRGLAELHDRAEHTMLLPMDGPGQWPPDADAIDAIEPDAAAKDTVGGPPDTPEAPPEPRAAVAASGAALEDDLQLLELRGVAPAAPAPEPVEAPPPPSSEKPARKGKAGKRASTRKRREVEEVAAPEPPRTEEPEIIKSPEPPRAAAPEIIKTPEPVRASAPAPEPVTAPEPVSLKGGPKTFDVNDLKDVEIPETPKPAAARVAEPVAPSPVAPAPVAPAPVAAVPVAPAAAGPEMVAAPEPVEQPVSDPDIEAAIRDLAPIEDTITPPVVDLAEASNVSLDDLAKDFGGAPLFGPAADESVDLDALIAESNSLESAASEPAAEAVVEPVIAPVAVPVAEPVATIAVEPEIPSGPVFALTNPTAEDFRLPVEDDEHELAAVAAGLTSSRDEFYPVLLLDSIVEEVPAGPVLELTNPTIDDFPEPIDPDDITDRSILDGFEEVKAEFPLIDLIASLPDLDPEVVPEVAPEVVPEAVLAPPPVVARVNPSLVALQRFLRQVEHRKVSVMSESRV